MLNGLIILNVQEQSLAKHELILLQNDALMQQ